MRMLASIILISALGLANLSKAQLPFSISIPDSSAKELLLNFQSDFGKLLYQEITRHNIAVFHDKALKNRLTPEAITRTLSEVISYVGFDETTFEEKELVDTFIHTGEAWEAIRWDKNIVQVTVTEGRQFYIRAADCIKWSSENPSVKKRLHLLLLNSNQFELSDTQSTHMGNALIDSLQQQINNLIKLGKVKAYESIDGPLLRSGQLDSLFKSTISIFIDNDKGELEETEVMIKLSAEEQIGFELYGTSSAGLPNQSIQLDWLSVILMQWDMTPIRHYHVRMDELSKFLDKKESLLFELLLLNCSNPLKY